MVIPVVGISILKVITDNYDNNYLKKIPKYTIITLLLMTTVAAIIGIAVGIFFSIGSGIDASLLAPSQATNASVDARLENLAGFPAMMLSFVPNDFIDIFTVSGVVGVIIFASLFGIALNRIRSKDKHIDVILNLINSTYSIIFSMIL